MKVALLSTENLDNFVCYDKLLTTPLAELGWEVEVVPWRADEDWNRFAAVIVRSPWDYQDEPERFVQVLKEIDATSCRLENALELITWNLDKRYLIDLKNQGVPIVPTNFHDTYESDNLYQAFDIFSCNEIILKPCISANTDDTFRLAREGVADTKFQFESLFQDRPHMVQPFLKTVVRKGEYSFFYFDGEFSHAILKTPKPGDFRVQEEHGGVLQSVKPSSDSLKACGKIMSSLKHTPLYARIDLVFEKHENFLMEIELIEPSLYFNLDSRSAGHFASAFNKWMVSRAD